jgi:hypothetical protein
LCHFIRSRVVPVITGFRVAEEDRNALLGGGKIRNPPAGVESEVHNVVDCLFTEKYTLVDSDALRTCPVLHMFFDVETVCLDRFRLGKKAPNGLEASGCWAVGEPLEHREIIRIVCFSIGGSSAPNGGSQLVSHYWSDCVYQAFSEFGCHCRQVR